MEQLEQKRLLTVEYYGVTHSNTTANNEDFVYQVGVTDAGTSQLHMRYNALQNEIQFSDNSSFLNTRMMGIIPSGFGDTHYGSTDSTLEDPTAGGFALATNISVTATWNGVSPPGESFQDAGLSIHAEPGTEVFVANGDAFPIALFIGGNGGSPRRSNTVGASFSNNALPFTSNDHPDVIEINGPISNSNPWVVGAQWYERDEVEFSAVEIIIDAEIDTQGAEIRAENSIELKNKFSSNMLNTSVSTGDWNLFPGAELNSNAEIRTGSAGGDGGAGYGFGGDGGDILIDGTINAGSINLQTNSSDRGTHIKTGPSGLISGNNSLTVFNAGLDGGTIDIQTKNYSVTNVNVGGPTIGELPDIGISIDQIAGSLTIAAVPSSKGQISLKASGGADAAINVDAGISTVGGLRLEAGSLNINSVLDTETGNIELYGNSVSVGGNVHAGSVGVGNVKIESNTAGVSLGSAATIQADTGTIKINAKTSIDSTAILDASLLDLIAGQSIKADSNAERLRSEAGQSITIGANDDLIVEFATSQNGGINISSAGDLDVQSVSALGTGDIIISGGTGVDVNRLRTVSGAAVISTLEGSINIDGDVTVQGEGNSLTVSATSGNIVIDSTSTVSVADQIALSTPKGRILTPGQIVGIELTPDGSGGFKAGSGYTSSQINVSIKDGGGATASPVLTNGGIASIKLFDGGSGYVTPPSVNLIGGGGTNASAEATIDFVTGVITSVEITSVGANYTSVPEVRFVGGSGQGAEAEALLNGVLEIDVTNSGTNYLTPPEVIISAGEGATSGPVSVDENGVITSVHLGSAGRDFGQPPNVSIVDSSGAGSGANAIANLSQGVTSSLLRQVGTGYAVPPVVQVIDSSGSGSGAVLEATISGPLDITNVLNLTNSSINPTNGIEILPGNEGDAYSPDVLVSITGGGGTGATAEVEIDGSIGGNPSNVSGLVDPSTGNRGRYSVQPDINVGAVVGLPTTPLTSTSIGSGGSTVDFTQTFQVREPALTLTSVGTVTYPGFSSIARSLDLAEFNPGYTGSAPLVIISIDATSNLPVGIAGIIPGQVATSGPAGSIDGLEFFDSHGASPTGDPHELKIESGVTGSATVSLSATGGFELGDSGFWQNLSTPNSGFRSHPSVSIPTTLFGPGQVAGSYELTVAGPLDASTIALTAAGDGYSSADDIKVLFIDSSHTGLPADTAEAETYINGSLQSLRVITPGTSYDPSQTDIVISLPNAASGGFTASTGTRALANPRFSNVIESISVTNGGSNYNPATTSVSLDLVAGGSGAVVSPVQVNTAGTVLGVNVATPGIDYVTPPEVSINDLSNAGRDATATAVLGVGLADLILGGTGYQLSADNIPVWLNTTNDFGDKSFGVASTNASGEITSVEILQAGEGYLAKAELTSTINPGTGAILGVTIDIAGAGYTPGDTLDLEFEAPPAGGTLPSGWTATIGPNGQIKTVNLGTTGLLYDVAPAVSIAPPSAENQYFRIAGTNDALATVLSPLVGSSNDEVATGTTAITIDFAGSGYDPSAANIPVLFEPSPTGDTAQGYATANGSGNILSVTVTHGGSGYTSVPRLIIAPSNNALTTAPALVAGAVPLGPFGPTHGGVGYIADGTVAVSFEPSPTGDTARGSATAAGGVITGINVTNGGSGYSSVPHVRIDPPAYDALATVPAIVAGAVPLIAITPTNGGSGYEPLATNLPVVFEASPTGTGDTARGFATANAAGEITSITVTDGGSGYPIAPAAVPKLFIAPPQSARAYMSVVGVDMLDGGTGYDANQTVVEFITSGSGAKAVANLDTNNEVASVTMVSSGSGYTVDPIVRIAGYGEGAVADAQIDSSGSVESLGPGNGHNITVTSGGSNYAVAPEVEFDPSPALGGVTAEGIAVIGNIVEIAGARLSWEALETPIPAFISQFSIIEVHLTGTGDLNLQADTGSLTIEGASTKDGNISISAPSLTISGDVEIGDYDSSRDHTISLTATVSDIVVDAQVGNLLEDTLIRTPLSTTISLNAAAGMIAAGESGNGLIVGNTLSFISQDSVTLNTDVSEVSGEVRQSRADISLTQNTIDKEGVVEDLVLTNLQATGGSIEVIGGAGILIGKVDATSTGGVAISGTGVAGIQTGDGIADVIGNKVEFYASTVGGITVDTEVTALQAAAIAGSVNINQVGFVKNPSVSSLISTLEILKVMASQDVTVTATSPVKANYVEASGALSITTDNAATPFESFDVELGSIAVDDEITIKADGNITSFAPLFEEPIIAAPLPPPTAEPAFLLSFDFDSALPASVVSASYAAAYRWAEIITADLDDVVDNNGFFIDDIHIEVNAGLLGGGDSPGGTLADARPLAFRSDTGIPYSGEVGVDLNDINDPGLIAIMTHEFGHVLGMPSASGFSSQISGDYFTGTNAVREYNTIFGQSADPAGVPLDATGGPGTAGAHWSYPVFGQELMIGYLTSNPVISAVTVGAMQDIGYEVNYSAADPYTPPSSLSGIHSIPSDLSGLRPCGCAFCIPVSLTSSFALEQEELITTETLRVIANDISGTSGERSIDLKTNVSTFAGEAGGNITIEESSAITLGETIDPLWLEVKSTSGSISVTAAGRITANNVHANHIVNGAIDFSSTASGVTLGTVTTNKTNVTSSGDVLDMTGKIITSPTVSIDATGSPIELTQNSHLIDVVSASSETSTDPTTRGNIGIKVAGNLDIDTVLGNEVTIIAENIVTDLTRIIANSLDVTSTKGGNIILDNLDNEIGAFGADARATVTASASATLDGSGGVDLDVQVTNSGRGYVPNSTTIPVTFTPPSVPGSTALGLATTDSNGVVISIAVTDPGSGYVTAPTVAINSPATPVAAGDVELISSLDNVALIGIDAKNVTLSVAGSISDVNPTVANTLAIAAGGTVSLVALGNDVDILTIADTAVDRVAIDNGGTGYTPLSPVVVTFSDPTSVKKVKIGNIGSGYGTNEEYIPVTFTAPLDPNGVTTRGYATANAAGEIESVTITNPGSGYVTLPTVTIGGAGTLAAASVSYERPEGTAQVDANGVIESITITKAGFGYSTTPSVVIDPPPTSLTATQATATASNLTPTAVTFVDADDLQIGPGGLYAGDANLQVGGKLSQVVDGEIQVTSLTVTSADDLDLTTAVNAVDVLSVANSGFDVDFRNNADLEISSSGLTANDVSITLAGDLTQDLTGTIDVNELQVLGNRGKIDLTSATNEIDKVGASGNGHTAINNQKVIGISFTGGTGYNVNQSNIPVTFGDSPTGDTATGYITADASGVITPDSLTITNPGSGYKNKPTVTIADPNGGSAPSATSEIAFHDIAINNSVATIIDGLEATGGAITISSTGTVTQSGQIIAKSLSVTSDVGIQLDTSTNNVSEFSATSDTDDVTYHDAGDVEVGSIKGVNIELNTIGSLTQTPSGSIEGTTLSITGSRDVTLTSTANDVDTIQASGIYLANADGFGLDYTDVDDLIVDGVEATGGSISITSGGTQTINNRVVAGAATAYATATLSGVNPGEVDPTVTIDFDGAGYQPAARATATATVTGGAVNLLPTITLNGAGYTSGTISVEFSLSSTGDRATGYATALNGVITGITVDYGGSGYITAPTVTIDPPTLIPVTFSAPLGVGTPAEGVALADLNGDITEVIVTNPGSGYGIPPTVTIDPPTLSSGRNIVLDAQGGDLVLNADVIAEGNTITLKATTGTISNGTILVPGGKLLTETLVWYATTPFNPVPNSSTHTIEGPNLTAPGDLDLDRLSLPSVTFAGASVVDGFVTIRAHSLTLNDLVRAAGTSLDGTGNAVTIETQTGTVTLTGDGRLESESGDIIVSAATSLVVDNPTVTHATATAGTLVIKKPTATATVTGLGASGEILDPNVTVSFHGVGYHHAAIATATATITGDKVDLLPTLTGLYLGGRGYTPNSTTIPVTFDPPPAVPGAITAQGFAIADSNGVITSINVFDQGAGYVAAPTVTIDPPTSIPVTFGVAPFGGTKAEGVAITDVNGFVTNINLTNSGSGYDPSDLPEITISDPTFGPSVGSLKTDVQKIDVIADSSLNIVEANDIEIVRLETDSNPIVLQAGGITQSGALIAPSLTVTNVAGDVVLDSTSNDVQSIAIANAAGDVTYTNSSSKITDIAAGGIQAVNVALDTANGLSQSGAIVATSLDVTNSAGTVVLDQSNTLTNVEIDNTGRDITLINTAATNISAGGIQGSTVVLNTAGLTQTGAIAATDLAVTNTAGTVVLDQNNVLGEVGIINTGRDITLTNTTATNISAFGIEGDTVVFNIANGLTQTGVIVATSLDVTNTVAGNVVLDQNNDVATVGIINAVGDVTYTTNRVGSTATATSTLDGTGVDSTVTVTDGGTNYLPVTTIPVVFSDSPTSDTATGFATTDSNGAVTSITVTHAGSGYSAAPTITINAPPPLATDIAGIQGENVVLNADNGFTQSGAITATSLDVTNTVAGNVVLDQNNDVATVAITNAVGDVTYTTMSSSITDINGIQGENIVLNTDHGVSQSAAITATSLDVTNTVAGNVVLDQNNDVATVGIINAVGDVTYTTNRVGSTATATSTLDGTGVDSTVTVTDGGTNYLPVTTIPVVFSDSPTSDTATGFATTDSNGAVTSITVTHAGSGYSAAPTITINAPPPLATDIAGIQGENVVLNADNGFTQSGAITATSLDVTNAATGSVVLANGSNDVDSLTVINTTRAITYSDSDDVILNQLDGSPITINAGGNVTQVSTIQGTDLIVTAGGEIDLDTVVNSVDTFTATSTDSDITLSTNQPLVVAAAGIDAGLGNIGLTVTSGGLTQVGELTGASLALIVTDGDVVLDNALNDVDSLAALVEGTNRSFTFNDKDDLIIGSAGTLYGIVGENIITLSTGGHLTQTHKIQADSLKVSNTAERATATATITVGFVNSLPTITSGGARYTPNSISIPVTFTAAPPTGVTAEGVAETDSNGVVTSINVTDPGSGYVIAPTVTVDLPTGGDITLTNPDNKFDFLEAINTDRSISIAASANTQNAVTTINGMGIEGNTVNLVTEGIAQIAQIKASFLDIQNSSNAVVLNDSNAVDNIEISSTGNPIGFTNTVVTNISTGGIQGTTITLNTVGLEQDGAIEASNLLDITNTSGNVKLDQQNTATSFSIDNDTRGIQFTAAEATTIAAKGIQGSAVELTTAGLTQSGSITATSLDVTNSADAVVLTSAANSLTNVEIDNTGNSVSFTNSAATNISPGGIQGSTVALNTAGLTQTGAIAATDLAVTNTAGTVVLDQNNVLGEVGIINTGRDITLTNTTATNISAFGIEGDTVVFNIANGLTQTGVIVATSLDVTNSADAVVLTNAANSMTDVEIDNTGNSVSFTNAAATNISAGGIQGSTVVLNTAGLTQSGAITATSLDVTNSADAVVLTDATNSLTNVEIDNTGNSVSFTNAAATNISAGGIQGSTVVLNTAGLTQSGAITATSLDVTNSADAVVLTDATNSLTNVEIDNTGNSVSFTNSAATNISAGGIQGSFVTLNTVGLTQTGSIDASAKLTVTNTQGDVTLTQLNNLAAIEIANPLGNVDITNATSMSVNGNGITGNSVSLDVTGDLTAFADITSATSFDATVSGTASFTSVTASGGSLEIDAGSDVSVQNSLTTQGNLNVASDGAVTLNQISAPLGSVTISGNGAVELGQVSTPQGSVTITSGSDSTLTGTTSIGTDLIIDSAGSVEIENATVGNKGTIEATGDVEVGTKLETANDMIIDATGGFYVSTLTDGVAKSSTEIDLRNVDGDVRLINGGIITAPSVLLREGAAIGIGAPATMPSSLEDAFARINDPDDLPTLPNAPYEIVVADEVSLTNTITINRPVIIRGGTNDASISGNTTVDDGIVLSSNASGSTISNLTFANFSGTALTLDNVTNTVVENNTFINGGTGVLAKGTLTNTVARGNVFESLGRGLDLDQATAFTFGGSTIGEPNEMKDTTLGIYADGNLVGTKLLKTKFAHDMASHKRRDLSRARNYVLDAYSSSSVTRTLEESGDMHLKEDVDGKLYANDNPLYLSGTTQLTVDYFAAYTPVAVEDFGSGDKRLVLKHTTGDLLTFSMSSTWTRTGNLPWIKASDAVSLNAAEVDYGTDLDNDTDVGLTELESAGTTMLKQDADGKIYANNNPLYLSGTTQLTVDYFAAYTPVAVEDFGGVDGKRLVLKHTTGDLLTFSMSSTWTRTENLPWIKASNAIALNAAEVDYNTDLDNDGDVGLRELESEGTTMLKQDADGKIYANNNPLYLSGTTQLTVDYFAAYTPVAVEDFGGVDGKRLVLKHTTGDLLTFSMSSTWTRTGNLPWIKASNAIALNAAEVDYGTDLDNDGDVGLTELESEGTTMLKRDADGKLYANNNPLYLSGTTQLTVDSFAAYTFVAVEDFGGGDKRLVLKHTAGNLLTFSMSSTWTRTGNLPWIEADDVVLYDAENLYGVDFNNDGNIGLPALALTTIENQGNTLLNRDADGKLYANNNPLYLSGTTQLTVDYFAGYTFVAVEDFGGGDKRLVLKHTAGNLLTFSMSSTWTRTGNLPWIEADDQAFNDAENLYGVDFNNDGEINGFPI